MNNARNQFGGAFSGGSGGTTIVCYRTLHTYVGISGVSFVREEAAAWAFGYAYTLRSSEYAANIYRDGTGRYIVRDIVSSGSRDSVVPLPIDRTHGEFRATDHTHSTYDGPGSHLDIFSRSDIANARPVEYVVTPGGYLIRYTRSPREFEVISHNIRADARHPNPNDPNFRHQQ